MAIIIQYADILSIVKSIDVVDEMQKAFVQYSNGNAVVPPVAELLFDNPPGDVHIKYGYIKGGELYCIKIASGFYDNPKLGLPSSQGLILLFNQKTGCPEAVLLDRGKLTDIRTAAAGAVSSKYFAPKKANAIGIIGTGTQAKLQLEYLQPIIPCKTVWVWGRNKKKAAVFKSELGHRFDIHIATTPSEVAQKCNLIVTTTPSQIPLLKAGDVLQGTHITAVGSDTSEKQELPSELLENADIVVVDSVAQSKNRGEVFRATKEGKLSAGKVVELGHAIEDQSLQRQQEDQITIADLTGVAVQDIAIAKAVYHNYKIKHHEYSNL